LVLTGTLEGIHHLFASGKVEQALSHLDQNLAEIHQFIKTLNGDAGPLLKDLRQLLAETSDLARTARQQIDAIAPDLARAAENTAELTTSLNQDLYPLMAAVETALQQGTKTLTTLDSLVASDSPTRHQFDSLLRETTEAARSIRVLAEYLERHPEALLSGKSGRERR
jgi:paraquat-inducible protein B